ncbi:cytochrome P450 1A1-like [Hyalella azteca]|uniref:Cytochrome P450 1A1-like n=1 Tax=Hyalella azteca TaxID=294128 RepID=A0A8B7NE60_HYAAZ|nr:cytochrome P450 1A1-like [Hyalella azteca]
MVLSSVFHHSRPRQSRFFVDSDEASSTTPCGAVFRAQERKTVPSFARLARVPLRMRWDPSGSLPQSDGTRQFDAVNVDVAERKHMFLRVDIVGYSQLVWLLSDLFIVGLDTTVTTLRWSVLFFIKRPKVTQKLVEEIDSVIGSERKPCLNDRDNMPYMGAFINEVMRFSTITPLAAHATPEDTTLGEYHIPKQTLVIVNLWGIHHDPKSIVVINSQEWLYQAFVKQGDHFNHRHHSTVIYFITNGRGRDF